jgi:hypothetical protein
MPTIDSEFQIMLTDTHDIGDHEFRFHVDDRGSVEAIEMKVYNRHGEHWHDLPTYYDLGRPMECAIYRQAHDFYCKHLRSDVLRDLIKSKPAAVVGERNRMGV